MILPPIHELTIVGIGDPGIANKERIVIRPTEPVNSAAFGLFLGMKLPNDLVVPYQDNFFWFGELIIEPPSWIIVYTGPGDFQKTTFLDSKDTVYIYHWGKKTTVFNRPDIVAFIFKYSAITIGQSLPPSIFPQLKG